MTGVHPIGATDAAWSVPWLEELRDVPADASWPRLMSAPHPRAVGSYGAELVAFAEARSEQPLRWWQRLLSARLLEHDAAGSLVWLVCLLSTPRQVGKSWWLRELCLWRLHQQERFGEPQLVLHTGKDTYVCKEVQRPARAWARRHVGDGWVVREANGQEEITSPDESRWLLRAQNAVYGYSASLGVVDEAWKVAPAAVEDGLEPTMPEREQPQLVLVSTAHRRATSLMRSRRVDALARLGEPRDVLLMEWSAPDGSDVEDRAGWRAASPHWSARRERLVESKLLRALQGRPDDPDEDDPLESFRSQWLNIWPSGAARVTADGPLLEDDRVWAAAVDLLAVPSGAVVAAVEDRTGLGAAAAAAVTLADGRMLVWGSLFESRAHAWSWVSMLNVSRLLVGASLAGDEVLASSKVPVEKVGASETSAALPKLRELLAAGRLVHDGGSQLAVQVYSMRVVERAGGLAVTSRGRSDLARCAAWVVWAAAAAQPPKPMWAAV